MRREYQTYLSDAEWSYIEPYLPAPQAPGRPRVHTLREIVDAIFYIVRSGCAWRLLPHDLEHLEDRTSLLQEMAFRRHLGEDALSPAQASACPAQ
jgi:hypothetical protein